MLGNATVIPDDGNDEKSGGGTSEVTISSSHSRVQLIADQRNDPELC